MNTSLCIEIDKKDNKDNKDNKDKRIIIFIIFLYGGKIIKPTREKPALLSLLSLLSFCMGA